MCPGGPFLESPGNFSGPQGHSKISNLTITELFYSLLLIRKELPFIQDVSCVYTSLCQKQMIGASGQHPMTGSQSEKFLICLAAHAKMAVRCRHIWFDLIKLSFALLWISLLFSVMNEYEEDTWSKYVVDNNANVGNMFGNRCIQVRRPRSKKATI